MIPGRGGLTVTRKRIHSAALVAALLAGSALPSPLAQPREDPWAAAIAASREAVRAMMERSGTPGLSVAVAAGGKIVWSEGFGYADLERRVPATPQTRFGVGSISKSLTTALMGRLVDDGALDIDVPVEMYLPDFPHAGLGITTRLIAAHLSGIDDRTERKLYYTARHFDTTREALEALWNDPLVDEPGTQPRYGTGTYTIIAAIVERATDRDFLSEMQRHVLDPLGLAATVANERRKIIPDRTAFYERTQGGEVVNAPYYDPSFKWAGAGYLSTAEDLVRFGVAMSGPGFLSAATRDAILAAARTTDGTPIEYALGWDAPRTDGAGPTLIGKSGGGPGISGYVGLIPECDLVIAILTNMSRAPVRGQLFDTVAGAFLERQACRTGGER
jgi:serine beta-lactamase-like protein LACTB